MDTRLIVQRFTWKANEFPGDEPGTTVIDQVLVDVNEVMDLEFEDDPTLLTPQKLCFSSADFPVEKGEDVYMYVLLQNGMPIMDLVPYDPQDEEFTEAFMPPQPVSPVFLQ